MQLRILVGTVTDTAYRAAQAMALQLADRLDAVEVLRMDGLDIGVFDDAADTLYLICTSTYGAGDLPDNAHGLYESLDTRPRYLGAVRYGLFALGDRAGHPDTFCQAGRLFDGRLQDLGARRIADLQVHDSADDEAPETAAAAWAQRWLDQALPPA